MKKLLSLGSLLLLIAIASPGSAQASNLAADNSLLYPGMSWPDNSNNGFGFSPWAFDTGGTNSGRYIGGSGDGLNTFALFAADPNSTSGALRPFTGGPLLAGQTFSISIGYNQISAGGLVGLDLRDSGGNAVFSIQGDGSGDWLINDGGSFFGSGAAEANNTPFVFTFTYNGGQSYTYTLGAAVNTFNATSGNIGDISSVRLYSFQQGGGNNFGFDNLAVVPEPGTWVMVLGGLGMLTLLRRRRA